MSRLLHFTIGSPNIHTTVRVHLQQSRLAAPLSECAERWSALSSSSMFSAWWLLVAAGALVLAVLAVLLYALACALCFLSRYRRPKREVCSELLSARFSSAFSSSPVLL